MELVTRLISRFVFLASQRTTSLFLNSLEGASSKITPDFVPSIALSDEVSPSMIVREAVGPIVSVTDRFSVCQGRLVRQDILTR